MQGGAIGQVALRCCLFWLFCLCSMFLLYDSGGDKSLKKYSEELQTGKTAEVISEETLNINIGNKNRNIQIG